MEGRVKWDEQGGGCSKLVIAERAKKAQNQKIPWISRIFKFQYFPHAGFCVLEREIHFSVCMNGGIALVSFWGVAGIGEKGEELMRMRWKQTTKRGLKSHENVQKTGMNIIQKLCSGYLNIYCILNYLHSILTLFSRQKPSLFHGKSNLANLCLEGRDGTGKWGESQSLSKF